MNRYAWPLPFGATYSPEATSFRLWAPEVSKLTVELADGSHLPMARDSHGWHEAIARVPPGTPYRYRGPEDQAFADPASRQQVGGVRGWSVVVDPLAHAWQAETPNHPWEAAVIYELHVGLLGGFCGVTERLPAIASLGFTAIELMPIADFPGVRNWGYDGVLLFAPAEAYGPPGQLKEMIDTAHGLGLMVMIDVVYNHFGPDGNPLPGLAPAFFASDTETPWGSAINFSHPTVAEFFAQNALYWLNEYRFDGLRFDAAHAIYPRKAVAGMARFIRSQVDPSRSIHLVLENEDNDSDILKEGFDAQWNDDFHHCFHVIATGEHESYYADFQGRPIELLRRSLQSGFVYQANSPSSLAGAAGSPRAIFRRRLSSTSCKITTRSAIARWETDCWLCAVRN